MTMRPPWLCDSCQRYTGSNTCDAFPQGIPAAVLAGAPHFDPLPGDNELQYLSVDGDPGLAIWLAYWMQVDKEE